MDIELTNEIKKFFKEADSRNFFDGPLPLLSSVNIRRALFRRYYEQDEFKLNETADAAEAFNRFCEAVHSADGSFNKCNSNSTEDGNKCLSHSNFGLKWAKQEICICARPGHGQ